MSVVGDPSIPRCGVEGPGVVWPGAVWWGLVWCGVVWCGVVQGRTRFKKILLVTLRLYWVFEP